MVAKDVVRHIHKVPLSVFLQYIVADVKSE